MKHFTLLVAICFLSWQSNSQITTYPYSEDFEGGAGGWAASGTLWQLGTPAAGTITGANSGTNSWATNLTGNYVGNANAIVTSPVFDFSAVLNPLMQLSIWWNSENSWDGTVLQSSIDGGASWQNIGNLGDPDWYTDNTINGSPGGQQVGWSGIGNGSWITTTHDLTGLGGNTAVTLRFAFGSDASVNSYDGFAFDDINIINLTCPQPVSIVVDSTDLTTGSLSWTPTGNETEWEIEYGLVGFIPGTGTSVLTSPNPWYTVTGLTSNSFYEFYVSAACALNDTSFQTGPITFNTYNQPLYMEADTECPLGGFIDISTTGAPTNLTDDGEIGVVLPFPFLYQGNLINDISIGNNGDIKLGTLTGFTSFGGNMTTLADGLYPWLDDLDSETGNVYYETIGTAPNRVFVVEWFERCNFSGSVGAPNVTFEVQIEEATNEIYFVYDDVVFGGVNAFDDYGASADIGVAGPVQDINTSNNDTQYLTDNTCAHYFYTDCPKPSNFSVSYTTANEGAITWSAGLSGETNWTVIYGPAGFDPTQTGTSISTSTPALIMPGLNDITTYDVYIYADCGPGLTSNEYMGSFTTLPNCADPTGIAAASAVDTLFSVWSWTENVGYPSTGFGVDFGWSGYAGGTGTTVWVDNNFTDTTADNSLIGGGVYEVYIQAVCGTDSSNWVGPVSFTMPLTNDSTCFAEDLAVDGTLLTFNNAGATTDANEGTIAPPALGNAVQNGWSNSNVNSTVWYTFTAPASGNVRINCEGINFDGQLAAYEATDCNDFATYTLVGANDDSGNAFSQNPPLLNLCGLTPGNSYFLMYDSWSTTATGTYNMTLTDVDITAGTDNGLTDICLGDTVDLFTNITGNDAGGVWYENIPTANFNGSIFVSSGLASQVFDFNYIVTDGCAADTVSTQVEIYAPSSAGSDGTITACLNQPVDLLDGLGGNVDLGGDWYDPTNTLITSTGINSGPIPGQFNYDYITGNGVCLDDSANIIVDVDFNCDYLNLQDLFFNGMDIHPNPTTGMVYISNYGSTEVFNMELTDLNGKVITAQAAAVNGTETTEVNLETLETGIYLVRVFNDNAEKTFRVVKQ